MVIGGRFVLKNRIVLTLDEKILYAAFAKLQGRLSADNRPGLN